MVLDNNCNELLLRLIVKIFKNQDLIILNGTMNFSVYSGLLLPFNLFAQK